MVPCELGLSGSHLKQTLGQRAEIPLGRPTGQSGLDFSLQDLFLQRLAFVGMRRSPRLVVPRADASVYQIGCVGRPGPCFHLSLIHISEPTRLGMISYAVFCLKKKKII